MTEDTNVVPLALSTLAIQSLFAQGSDDPVIALAEEASKAWLEYRAANPQAFSDGVEIYPCRWRTDRLRKAMNDLHMADEPVTLAGLAAKARVVRLIDDEDIMCQLAFDIGLLAGEIDPNAIPEGCEPVGREPV
jgi:hypothetical protein